MGAWTLQFSGDPSQLFYDPQFIDRGPLAGDHLGAPSFALTTSARPNYHDTSDVARSLNSPLVVGQTFSVDIDGSALDPAAIPFMIGNTFQLFGTDGQERFGLFTNNDYNRNHWTATGDADTGIPAASAFHVAFTLAGVDTYNLVITPFGGGYPTMGLEVRRMEAGNCFSNLVIGGPSITGDYNRNGVVDAADYVVWRDTLDQSGSGLVADGNGNNVVDAADYAVWRSQFGVASASALETTLTVPEPCADSLVVIGIYLFNSVISRRSITAA